MTDDAAPSAVDAASGTEGSAPAVDPGVDSAVAAGAEPAAEPAPALAAEPAPALAAEPAPALAAEPAPALAAEPAPEPRAESPPATDAGDDFPGGLGVSLAGESLALGGAVQPPAPSPRALARQLATRLEQTYPNAIFPLSARRVKPLKLGIHKDLMPTVRDWGYPAAALKIFLSHYTGMMRYQVALTKEPVRVDLQGEPAGEVSDDNRQMAQTQIVQLKARRRQRAEAAAPGEKPVEGEVGGGGEAAGSEAAAGTAPDASAPRPRPAKPRRRRPPRSAAPAAEGSGETVASTPPGEGGEKTAAEGNNPPLQQVSPRAQRPRGEHPRGERPPRRGDGRRGDGRRGDGRRGDGRRGPEGRGTANTPPQQDEAAAAAKAFDAEAANRPARPLGQLDDSILAELQAKLTRKAMR